MAAPVYKSDEEIQALINEKLQQGWIRVEGNCPESGRPNVLMLNPQNNSHYSAALGQFVLFQPSGPVEAGTGGDDCCCCFDCCGGDSGGGNISCSIS